MSRIFYLTAFIFFLVSCESKTDFEEPSANYFLKFYGKQGNHSAADLIVNPDGSFYILGTSEVPRTENQVNDFDHQVYVAQVGADGMVIWEHDYGNKSVEEAIDIEFTTDGKLLVLVSEKITATDSDIKLYLLDANGSSVPLDSVSYGVEAGLNDYPVSVTELPNGYIVCGSKDTPSSSLTDKKDAIQVMFSKDLTVIDNSVFRQVYGPGNSDVAIKAYPYKNSSVLVFGHTNAPLPGDPNGSNNYWIYLLNIFGVSVNELKIGSPLDNEILSSVSLARQASGDGYLMAGQATNSTQVKNPYLLKLNKDLTFNINLSDIQFQSRLSDDLGAVGDAHIVSYSSVSSGYLILATQKKQASSDLFLTKIDNRGSLLWQQPVILGGVGDDLSASVSELSDGKIMICATMTLGGETGQKKIALMKLNSYGRLSD